MSVVSRIKDSLGRIGKGKQINKASGGPAQSSTATTVSQQDILHDPLSLTPEEIIDSVSFDKSWHQKFTDAITNVWRVGSPFAFVGLTAWEVYYFIHIFMVKSGDNSLPSQVLIWGVALYLEIHFMVSTFDQAKRRQLKAESKSTGKQYDASGDRGSLVTWFTLAFVNMSGQVAFLGVLLGISKLSPTDPTVVGMYFFIAIRTVGMIIGDANVAFFIRPEDTTIEKILRIQEGQAKGRIAITENRAHLGEIVAESEEKVRHIEMRIRRERIEADFMQQMIADSMEANRRRQQRAMRAEERADARREIEEVKQDRIQQGKPVNTEQLNGL